MLLFLFCASTAQAQLRLNSSNPDVTVDACGSFPSAAYGINNIDLSETAPTDFVVGTNKAFTLELPSGFYFTGTPAITALSGSDLDNLSIAIGTNTAVLEIELDITDTNTTDILRLSGLQIIAATDSVTGTLDYVQGTDSTVGPARLALFQVSAASAAVNLVGGSASGSDKVYSEDSYSVSLSVTGFDNSGKTPTYKWYRGLSSVSANELVPSETGASLSVTPAIQSSGTYYYLREMNYTNGDIVCTARSASVSVTVVTLNPGSISAAATTICLGDPVSLTSSVDATANSESVSYIWQQAGVSGVFANVTSGTYTSSVLSLAPNTVTQTTQYKRLAYSSTSSPSTVETTVLTISVNRFPNANVGIAFANGSTSEAFICPGGDPIPFLDTSTGYPTGTSITHQWQEKRSDGSSFATTWTNIGGATVATYNPPPVSSSVYYRRLTTSTLNGVACDTKATNELLITMGESVILGSIKTTATPAGKVNNLEEVVFKGGTASPIISETPATATNGIVSYQWYTYTDSSPALSPISGATSSGYTPTAAINQTTYYVRAATNTATNTITNNLDTCGIYNSSVTLKAAVPTPGSFDTNRQGCALNPITLSEQTASTYPTYYSFQWQSSLAAGSGFTDISGATERAYSTSTLTQTTYFRRIASLTLSGTSVYTPTTAITVEINALDPGSISYSGGALCYGEDPAQIIGGGSPTAGYDRFQWFSSTDGSTWNSIGSSNTVNYNPGPLTQTTYYKRTLYKTVSGSSCSASTESVTIQISQEIVGGSLAGQTINSGGDPGTLTVTSPSLLSGLTYKWYASTDGGTTPTLIGTATATTYAPGPLTQTTSYKRVTFKTENGIECEAETNWATISVNTVTAGSISGSDTICSGESAPLSNAGNPSATAGGTVAFSWQAGTGPNSGAITWGAAIAGATASSYTPSNITSSTYYRRGYTSILNGVSSTVYTPPVLITVTPLPVIDNTAIAAAISNVSCALGSDGAIAVLPSHISGGNTAQQQITDITVGGSPATSDALSVILNGTIYTHNVTAGQSTATIATALRDLINADTAAVVTASISSTTNVLQLKADVSGTPFTALASVGDSSTATMITETVQANAAPNTYSWSKTGDASFTASSLSLSGLTAGTYTLAVTNGICTVNSANFVVSQPAVLDLSLTTNCTETLTATPSGGNGPYVYVLTRPDGTTTTPISKSTPHEFTGLTIGATYSVQITDSSCSTSVTKTLTVPTPMALDATQITTTNASCAGRVGGVFDGSINIPTAAISGGLPQFEYTISSSVLTSTITQINNGNFSNLGPGVYNILVTDAAGCSATASQTIDSLSPLNITFPLATEINTQRLSCEGDQTGSFTIAVSSDPSVSPVIKWFKSSSDVPIATSGLTISGLGAGNYRVEVSNGSAGQCMVSRSFTIIAPETLSASFETPISPKCYPNSTGSVKVNVSGGTAPYTYSIDGGVLSSFGTAGATALEYTIQNIPVGDHTIYISDANSCDVVTSPIISIDTVSELILTHDENSQVSLIECESPGSLSASVTGGKAPYFFKWTRSSDNYSFTQRPDGGTSTAANIYNSGNYNVEVTDANGCTVSLNVNMPNSNSIFNVTGRIISEQCVTEDSNSSRIELSTNAQAPYEVRWEQYGPKSLTTTSTTGSTTVSTTTTVFDWNELPAASGSLILNNLGFGDYRVKVSEVSNTSGCNTVVKTFSIKKSNLTIFEQNLSAPSCDNPEGSYSFKLNHNNALKYFLNGSQITPSSAVSSTFSLSNSTGKYTLSKLLEGSYTLRIVEQIPSGTSTATTDGCELFTNFSIANYPTVVYGGETNVTLNLCDNSATFPDPSMVSGGVPFEDENGNPFYIYQWNGPNNLSTQGVDPISVGVGTYELRIIDAQNCPTDPITFNFSNNVAPVAVTEIISPLQCGADNADGAINISISGGKAPYTIVWDKEIPATASSTLSYEEIGRNLLAVNNLAAGRYRLRITSSIVACENTDAITFTKFYTLNPVETLQLLEGPFLSRELCIGEPGSLQLKVFDRNSDSFSFYYNGNLVSSSPLGNNNFEVTIDQPVEESVLSVVNESGCSIELPVITGVGTPEFTYTSRSLEQTGLISANEDVSFTNTSIEPYTRMQWDFGDGSETLEITAENAAVTDIVHRYKTPGTFSVRLRFYNALGCYKETEQDIMVGKGYLVIFPSAFTPNNDGVNDFFDAKFTGITAFAFEVFDMWGNLLYTTTVDGLPAATSWGWDGTYPSGKPYTPKTFRYSFTATTHDNQQITTTGEATLLR